MSGVPDQADRLQVGGEERENRRVEESNTEARGPRRRKFLGDPLELPSSPEARGLRLKPRGRAQQPTVIFRALEGTGEKGFAGEEKPPRYDVVASSRGIIDDVVDAPYGVSPTLFREPTKSKTSEHERQVDPRRAISRHDQKVTVVVRAGLSVRDGARDSNATDQLTERGESGPEEGGGPAQVVDGPAPTLVAQGIGVRTTHAFDYALEGQEKFRAISDPGPQLRFRGGPSCGKQVEKLSGSERSLKFPGHCEHGLDAPFEESLGVLTGPGRGNGYPLRNLGPRTYLLGLNRAWPEPRGSIYTTPEGVGSRSKGSDASFSQGIKGERQIRGFRLAEPWSPRMEIRPLFSSRWPAGLRSPSPL